MARLAVNFVLFFSICMVGAISVEMALGRAKACPLYCLDVDYMTCQSSGEEKLSPRCNCCLAPKNCTLHLANGALVHC